MATMEDVLMQVVEEFAAFVDLASEEDIKPSCAEWGENVLKRSCGSCLIRRNNKLLLF